jgi:hypothetical protein
MLRRERRGRNYKKEGRKIQAQKTQKVRILNLVKINRTAEVQKLLKNRAE